MTVQRRSHPQILALWEEYRSTDDPGLRDRVVLTLAPLVKYIVGKKTREMPPGCELEDLISCGLEALIGCIDRYDPSKGATLEQFAWTRIHGAVIDELRRQDWAPRSVRRSERDLDGAVEAFTSLHGRAPSQSELADALAISEDELLAQRGEIARSDLTSLNTLVAHEDDTAIERVDVLASEDDALDPEQHTARAEAKDKFRVAFAQLSQRDREVAVLLYVENLTLVEIGMILGVSESRVSQIHTGLKGRLRTALEAESGLFEAVA